MEWDRKYTNARVAKHFIKSLPIGGYVKFVGEDEKSDDPRAFSNAKVWKRFNYSIGAFDELFTGYFTPSYIFHGFLVPSGPLHIF